MVKRSTNGSLNDCFLRLNIALIFCLTWCFHIVSLLNWSSMCVSFETFINWSKWVIFIHRKYGLQAIYSQTLYCAYTCTCIYVFLIGKLSFRSIVHESFIAFSFRNCTAIWEAFSEAFLYQPQCNVSDARMARYITLTTHTVPKDRVSTKKTYWNSVDIRILILN